jgi:hypothetical protein
MKARGSLPASGCEKTPRKSAVSGMAKEREVAEANRGWAPVGQASGSERRSGGLGTAELLARPIERRAARRSSATRGRQRSDPGGAGRGGRRGLGSGAALEPRSANSHGMAGFWRSKSALLPARFDAHGGPNGGDGGAWYTVSRSIHLAGVGAVGRSRGAPHGGGRKGPFSADRFSVVRSLGAANRTPARASQATVRASRLAPLRSRRTPSNSSKKTRVSDLRGLTCPAT